MISDKAQEKARRLNLLYAASQVTIFDFLECRDYLEAIYRGIKTNRNSYSYKKFAEDLGFSHSNVVCW